MPIYQVKPRDTLTSIAKAHGVSSWQALYNDPANAAFRSKRPNPNLIYPGDEIVVPAKASPAAQQDTPFRLAIIDGTGESDDTAYTASMINSFCRQLADQLGETCAHYKRGPSWHGKEVQGSAQEAKDWLKKAHDEAKQKGSGVRLMLAGYSRGGSAAIMAAEQLEKENIPVDSLFLFDAVARHHYKGGEVIPANVAYSRHARRDLNAILLVLKYEGTFSDVKSVNASNPLRPSFGNTGLTWRGNGDHQAEPFVGSHGALGGVGWSFVTEDPHCQDQVADWMNKQFTARGVPAVLKSMQIPAGPAPATPSARVLLSGWLLDLLMIARHNQNLKKAGKVP